MERIPIIMKESVKNAKKRIPAAPTRRLIVVVIAYTMAVCITSLAPSSPATADGILRYTVTNKPPVAVNDNVITVKNTPVTANALVNDHDPEGGAIHAVAETKNTAHGKVVILADGTFTYTPNNNYSGNDSFVYQVCDNANNCCTGTVNVTVVAVQHAPVATADFFSVNEDTPSVNQYNVLTNDTDADGQSLTAIPGKPAQHGTVVLNPNGTFTYTPNPNFNGTDTFTYYANDGIENSGETLVTITVVPVNDAPVAGNDAITTNEDVPIDIPVLANDTDIEDALVVSMIVIVTPPAHGTLNINPGTGKVTYTPNPDYFGNDSFEYKVKDSGGALSNTATVSITVNPVNDPPTAAPDVATTQEDVPKVISVLANDTDIDNAINTGSVTVVSNPSHGSVVPGPTPGTFTYTPDPDYYGNDSFSYTVKDVSGAVSLPVVVSITVTPVNDKPVAANDEVITDEDVPVSIAVLANDTDVDDVLTGSMIVIVTQPAHGTLSVDPATGKVTYTPAPDYFGNDSFQYQVKDAAGALSNSATVSITVNPLPDLPVASPDFATTPEDVSVVIAVTANDLMNGTVNLNPGSVSVVSAPSNGTVVAGSTPGSFLYTPDQDYFGTDSFTYTVKDMNGVVSLPGPVTITITPVNDAPVANNDAATTDENIPVGIPVLANDFDVDDPLDPASLVITTNPQHGTVSINTSSDAELVTYKPGTGFSGSDSFAYTIQDPGGLVSNPATVTISVINVNAPPVAVDDAVNHSSQLPVSIDVLANDYDPDNAHSELSIVTVTNPSVGTVTVVNGEIVYTPAGTASATVTFTYTITDPGGLTDEGTVTINYIYVELLVSQGFSPNGDGNNDTWYIKGIEGYPNNLVKVFDRWGLQVYQKSGYENNIAPWNGYGNIGQQAGKKVERGTYFYTLEPGGGLKRLEGYVMVVY